MDKTQKANVVRDPAEEPEPDAPAYGAILSPYGTVLAVPRAIGQGRPKPEPEERWTLGPERHEETSPEGGDEPPATPARAPGVDAVTGRPRRSDGTLEPEPEPELHGAILSPVGIVPVTPIHGVGRPAPEPDERWTLGPERQEETGAEGGGEPERKEPR